MILIGTMNLTRTKSTGDFYCPHCGSLRAYRLRARRPFLTLYFIPVFPIGAAEEFVQCMSCKTNSPVAALEVDERSFRENQDQMFRYSVFHSAVMLVVSDQGVTEEQIEMLIDLGNRILPEGIDREQLGALCSSIRLNRVAPKNYISTVSKPWSTEQQRLAVQILFLAASVGSGIDEKQLKLLSWLRDHFGMTETEYERAIEESIDRGLDVVPEKPAGVPAA
jgi:hypothetical protein